MGKFLSFDEYKAGIKNILVSVGLDESQSDVVADYMTTTDFYGVISHGARTLESHVRKIKSGSYNLTPNFDVIKETPAFALINGDNSIGMVSGVKCVEYAIEKAKDVGVFTVLSRGNNTYGAAFYYALVAAKRGMICFTMSNSPAQMAAHGGKDKILGTNPFAVAIPSKNKHPLVIDMATSVVAKSKFKEYKEAGRPLPEGWALDSDGNPTTDPDTAMAGLVLPMANFKGYGMSLIIDALSGFLSGAKFLDGVGRFYSSEGVGMDVGCYFTVISPELVYGEKFYEKFDEYTEHIRGGTCIGGEHIVLPGDDRQNTFSRNIKRGMEPLY